MSLKCFASLGWTLNDSQVVLRTRGEGILLAESRTEKAGETEDRVSLSWVWGSAEAAGESPAHLCVLIKAWLLSSSAGELCLAGGAHRLLNGCSCEGRGRQILASVD